MQRIDWTNASCTIKCIINSLKVWPVTPGVKGIMIIERFLAIHVKQTQCRRIWEKKRDTPIKMQDKSSKNGFETHTNTEVEENLPLRTF